MPSQNNIKYLDDPNSVNINTAIPNAIPQYQDMHIFAELTASRKGRSVIVVGEGLKTDVDVIVNFLGNNQNPDNPNYLNFTTNYYDGSTMNNETQFESFGITNIKVVINSSFIPQVSIQFVDLRGLSFFNQENSPYRILFDFPPPTFELKIKGYYGRTLSYKLHLVKYTTEFSSESGNFIINGEFVAITFAPLSDVLFRYIVNFPLMDNNAQSINSDTSQPPANTNDLILKLRNLYSVVDKQLKTNSDSDKYDALNNELQANKTATEALANFYDALKSDGNAIPYVFISDTSASSQPIGYENLISGVVGQYIDASLSYSIANPPATSKVGDNVITPLKTIYEYDDVIKNFNATDTPSTTSKRLYVGYISNPSNIAILNNRLDIYRTQLLTSGAMSGTKGSIVNSDISLTVIYNNFDLSTNSNNSNLELKYAVLDVTDFYVKLYKSKIDIEKSKKDVAKSINEKINNSIEQTLGMRPTIYNIFKIILNDVDKFFNILRATSISAQDHHNKPDFKRIIANYGMRDSGNDNLNDNIYAFPLIISKQNNDQEVRISPILINKSLPASDPFPEMQLVTKFIDTFTLQRQKAADAMMKEETDAEGNNVWIPISPFDSSLSTNNPASPYSNIDSTTGSVNLSADSRINQILKILLDRFYVLTQSSLPDGFYNNVTEANGAYVDLYSKSEALNLILSINNTGLSSNLKTFANNNKNPDNFYKYLSNNLTDVYAFPEFGVESIDNINGAYVDKTNPNYVGLNIVDEAIDLQQPTADGSKPLDIFVSTVERGFFKKLFNGRLPEESYLFTTQNLIFIKDAFVKNNAVNDEEIDDFEGISLQTRYLTSVASFNNEKTANAAIEVLLDKGNAGFAELGLNPPSENYGLKSFSNVVDRWIKTLSAYDDDLFDDVINTESDLSAIILLSNFGYTLSCFNIYPKNLNHVIFQTPAVVEVPNYLQYYIGGLVNAKNNGLLDELKAFYSTGGGSKFNGLVNLYMFADIEDIDKILSEKDKETFAAKYEVFRTSYYLTMRAQLKLMYNEVKSLVNSKKMNKYTAYESYLNPKTENPENHGSFFKPILGQLLTKTNIVIFSQNTFKNVPKKEKYVNLNANKKAVNDRYFKGLMERIGSELVAKENKKIKEDEETKKLSGDEDILTQTYYSFKNINDKWLCSPERKLGANDGYPFNKPNKELIDSFAFVDRAMNPIGDTVINPEILLDLFNDTNVSVYSVLAQILSMNGFEFFPLQNFMTYSDNSWTDTFKIDPVGEVEQTSAFVCMYIGGSSSYPTNINNGFKNDGILNIGTTDAKEFSSNSVPNPEYDSQYQRNSSNFPWRQVRAFNVKFGQQNQSMFSSIKIDSKEYPETNESIQILARLAGDEGKNAPIPKGQNLYNLYENRAYKATISGLGNAMIQPTQYFQLDNVPLYNGAYLIVSVEHEINANSMKTSFSGTKILRYPMPRVLNPAAGMGFQGGSSDETNYNTPLSSQSIGEIVQGASSELNPDKAKYNSMYTINIQ
jgi:hypothetical protein